MIFDALPTPLDVLVLLLPMFAYVLVERCLWKEARNEGRFRWGFVSWLMRWAVDPGNYPKFDRHYYGFMILQVVWFLIVCWGSALPQQVLDVLRQHLETR